MSFLLNKSQQQFFYPFCGDKMLYDFAAVVVAAFVSQTL